MDNLSVFPNKSAIRQEAGVWIVRLDSGELGDDEIGDFKNWIQRSDFHREYFLKLAANWDDMAILQELGEMFPLPEKETSPPARSLWSKLGSRVYQGLQLPRPLAISAAGVAALFLAVVLLGGLGITGAADEYVTAIGERRTYTLEDGTQVSLNTNTRIEISYGEARRAIRLVQGEATFDVAKNPERPFVVYAGAGLVWAVGTAFNVRHDAGRVDVIVTEGRVKVFSDVQAKDTEPSSLQVDFVALEEGATNAASIGDTFQPVEQREALLGAGEALRYRQVIESLQTIEHEERSRLLAWHEGSLVFKGETLEQAVAEISRYTDKELVIADAGLKLLRVGGHYKIDDIDALLASLGQGLGISVDYAADDRVLLSARYN